MDQPPTPPTETLEDDTLEAPSTVVEAGANPSSPPATPGVTDTTGGAATPPPSKRPKSSWRSNINFYLLAFGLVLVTAVTVTVLAYRASQHSSTNSLGASSLSQSTLSQLANSDATVGSSSQVLNVQSSAVFAGKVLVRSDLAVAGGLQIGGNLSLGGVKVAGSSTFSQVQISKDLAVAGNAAVQGQLTAAKNLSVGGNGNFNGSLTATQLTVGSLQLNGELNLNHHITAGGSTPGRSNGSALGSGGTSSVTGSDTSGTLNINTGSHPGAGCFATLTFASAFHNTPHITITPIGSAAAGLKYYVTRSDRSFSVCTTSPAPSSSSFAFDYLALD